MIPTRDLQFDRGGGTVGPGYLSRATMQRPWQQRDPGTPAINLRIFWLACLLTLVASHYSLAAAPRIPWLYRTLSVMVVMLTPLTAGIGGLLQQRAVAWLILFEFVLLVGSAVGFSGSPADLVSTISEPVVWVRCFPMLLCGFTLARYPGREQRWLLWLTFAFAFLSLPDIAAFLRGTASGSNRADVFIDVERGERLLGILNSYVSLAPACLFLALLALRIRDNVRKQWRWLVFAIQMPLLAVPLTAGFTAPAVLFFTSAVVAIVVFPVRSLVYRVRVVAVGLIAIAAAWLVLAWAGDNLGGMVGQVHRRLDSLRRSVMQGEVTGETNVATSGRIELAKISWHTFLRNPIIGAGGAAEDAEKQGGHSFFIDTLARFGIVGSFPLFASFASLIVMAVRTWRKTAYRWSAAAMVMFMASWVVALIVNPYFLGYITLNYIVFLAFGFIVGDSVYRCSAIRNGTHGRPLVAGGVATAASAVPVR